MSLALWFLLGMTLVLSLPTCLRLFAFDQEWNDLFRYVSSCLLFIQNECRHVSGFFMFDLEGHVLDVCFPSWMTYSRYVSRCLLLIWNDAVCADCLLFIQNDIVYADLSWAVCFCSGMTLNVQTSRAICFWSRMTLFVQTCLRLFAFDLKWHCLCRNVSGCLLLI